jgi:hypothetical protein
LCTMQRVRRGALVAVLALVGASVLTGCRSEPGIAAYIGAEKITIDQVDAVVDAVDKVNAERTADAPPGPIPVSRQLVLGLIVYGKLAGQIVDEKSLTPTANSQQLVTNGYGIPAEHPYAALLIDYLDNVDVLTKNAGTATPSKDQILRYYHAGVDAQMFTPGLPDNEVVSQGSQAQSVISILNVQTMLDELGKRQHLTVNPRYAPLAMPVLISDNQRATLTVVPFAPAGEPFVTDASGATG